MSDPILAIAAGWCKSVDRMALACSTVATHVVCGSYTWDARVGNVGKSTLVVLPDGSTVNAYGLPNGGRDAILADLPIMLGQADVAGKHLVLSLAASEPDEMRALVDVVMYHPVRTLEINLGCPNAGHAVIGLDPALTGLMLEAVHRAYAKASVRWGHSPHLWFKLSPTTDPNVRVRVVEQLLHGACRVDGVVVGNTLPGARPLDGVSCMLDVADGYGGMGGTGIRELQLVNAAEVARRVRTHLLDRRHRPIRVIGCGGVRGADDAHRYLQRGCHGVQVASAFFVGEHAGVLAEVLRGLRVGYVQRRVTDATDDLLEGFRIGIRTAVRRLREVADCKQAGSRGDMGGMFAGQTATDLRQQADHIEKMTLDEVMRRTSVGERD